MTIADTVCMRVDRANASEYKNHNVKSDISGRSAEYIINLRQFHEKSDGKLHDSVIAFLATVFASLRLNHTIAVRLQSPRLSYSPEI